jgi:hypothetical protein
MRRRSCIAWCLGLLGIGQASAMELPEPQLQQSPAPDESPRHGLLLALGRTWLALESLKVAADGADRIAGPRRLTSSMSIAFASAGIIRSEFFIVPVTADWYGRLVPGLQFEFDF